MSSNDEPTLSGSSVMQLSLIAHWRVDENKGGRLAEVDFVQEFSGMDDLALLLTHLHVCPGVFEENIRRKASFKSIQLVSFDFDDGTAFEDVRASVEGWNHVIAASKNHMKDKGDGRGIVPRFHLFLQLNEPINDPLVYRTGVEYLTNRFQLTTCDKAVKDVTRYFYQHPEILSCQKNGEVYPTRVLLEEHELRTVSKPRKTKREFLSFGPVGEGVFESTRHYRLLVDGGLRMDGERQANCLRILGAMKLCGLTKDQARDIIHAYAEWGSSFTVARVDGMLRDFWD